MVQPAAQNPPQMHMPGPNRRHMAEACTVARYRRKPIPVAQVLSCPNVNPCSHLFAVLLAGPKVPGVAPHERRVRAPRSHQSRNGAVGLRLGATGPAFSLRISKTPQGRFFARLQLMQWKRLAVLVVEAVLLSVATGGDLLPSVVLQQCAPQSVLRAAYTRSDVAVPTSVTRYVVLTRRRNVGAGASGLPESLSIQGDTGVIGGTAILPSEMGSTSSTTVGLSRRWTLPTVGAGGAAAFAIDGTNYVAITNTNNGATNLINSIVYKFNHAVGATAGGMCSWRSLLCPFELCFLVRL